MIHRCLMILVIATLLLMSCEAPEEPTEEPEPAVSVDIIPQAKKIDPGAIIKYKMDILNIGVDPIDLAIEHQLIQIETGKVIQTRGEIIKLHDQLIVERGLPTPTEKGQYEVKTIVTYADKSDTDRFQFEIFVEEPVEEKTDQQSEEDKIEFIVELLKQEEEQEELGPPDVTVIIGKWGFEPKEINIKVNQIVMWVNTDTNSHTVAGAGFDSGGLRRNAQFKHKFIQSGNYPYQDSYRPSLDGMVHVEE